MSKVIEGQLSAAGLKFAIVVSRFNSFITERLLGGAIDALTRAGCNPDEIDIVKAPGSWELPIVVKELANQKRHHAIIVLGALIRGETPHFDYIAGAAAKGLANIAADSGVPVAFGVLTTNTLEQAIDRAGAKGGNKGFDAAMSAVEMANLMRRLRGKVDPVSSRRRSRQRALQILFLWDVSKQPVRDAIAAYDEIVYSDEDKVRPARDEFLEQLVLGTVEHIADIDAHITKHAEHWRIERMPAVDRNLLRLAVHEMMVFDTPPAVVIDEALELARKYAGEESVQFVNGVLDAVHREIGSRGATT